MTTPVRIGITVNGEDQLLTEEISLRQLLERLGLPERGIAVAVGGAVFPKARWDESIQKGWDIDVLTAVQGG
ncbi:sulfur carrier protein ThiS [Antrihabitans cavernicola]|uniref:Sulfur carrier protein ThiS n=1 Tax=Antrihabitans cavernicola TaxID=2495913 RepID=A0A5A7SD36_9NOCA|nr:sulfur carrier protein ThiS [Spelaeibacter cavernicola]KAA0022121.1 sulfur carrier protein ThiS [Spelaeibacter cavernicola]